jgi:pimeloyl-ACP methyl ester carboxylesterase
MPTIDFVKDVPIPTALIAAGRDPIVPARRSEPLRRAIPNLIFDRIIADAGHNDLYAHPGFTGAMQEAFTRITVLSAASADDSGPEGPEFHPPSVPTAPYR